MRRPAMIPNSYKAYSGAAIAMVVQTRSPGLLPWQSRGSEHWLVSDVNAGELQGFAALHRAADGVKPCDVALPEAARRVGRRARGGI